MYNLNERETKILEEKCSCFSRSYHIMKDDNFYYVRRKGGILPTLVDTTLKFDGFLELSEFLEIIFSIINKKYDRIIELIDKNENIVNNIEVISFFNF